MKRNKRSYLIFNLLLAVCISIGQLLPITAETLDTSETTQVLEDNNDVSSESQPTENLDTEIDTASDDQTENKKHDDQSPEEDANTSTEDSEVINKEEVSQDDTENNSDYLSGPLKFDGGDYQVIAEFGEDAGFKKGTTLTSKEIDKGSSQYNHLLKQAEAKIQQEENKEISEARFFDITFVDKDGTPVEPVIGSHVNVRIDYDKAFKIQEEDTLKAVHFAHDGLEVLDVAPIGPRTNISAIELTTRSFSIFGITNTSPKRATINFYAPDQDGDNYSYQNYAYTDSSGNVVREQVVVNGNAIVKPGIPVINISHKAFQGWYYGEKNLQNLSIDEVAEKKGEQVDFSKLDLSNYSEINTPLYVYAVYTDVMYLTFKDSDQDSIIETKEVEKNENGLYVTTINDVEAIPSEENETFIGWTKDPSTNKLIEGNSITLEDDLTLYAVYKKSYSVIFESGDPDASYTPVQTVLLGEKAKEPSNPVRTGYKFEGWFDESGNKFDFNQIVTKNITLTARWTAADASYSIVIWKQALPKNGSLVTDEYDYGYTIKVDSKTDSIIRKNSYSWYEERSQQKGQFPISNLDYDFVGFEYSNTSLSSNTVKADGSTIVNVYYNRARITMTFKDGNNTFYREGLYGQTLDEVGEGWPGYTGWRDTSDNRQMTYLGQFILPDPTHTTITFEKISTGGYILEFYCQDPDNPDNYKKMGDSRAEQGKKGFKFTNKFVGFKVDHYTYKPDSKNNSEFYGPFHVQHNESVNNFGTSSLYPWQSGYRPGISDTGTLRIYFIRDKFDIHMKNGINGSYLTNSHTEENVIYGINISNLVSLDKPAFPGNKENEAYYDFVGWFTNPECTKYLYKGELTDDRKKELEEYGVTAFENLDNATMPAANVAYYAGWKKKKFTVTFETETENIVIKPKIVEATNRIPAEGLIDLTKPAYVFVGWKQVLPDGSLSKNFWDFNSGVTENITLRAVWKYEYALRLVYTSENKVVDKDTAKYPYVDLSDAKALAAPQDGPVGKSFYGWQILKKHEGQTDEQAVKVGEPIIPGSIFTIDAATQASYSSGTGNTEDIPKGRLYIWLDAVWVNQDSTTVTYHSNLPKDVTDIDEQSSTIPGYAMNGSESINQPLIDIPAGWIPKGYIFVGWNTQEDGNGEKLTAGSKKYILSTSGGNNLFAMWEPAHKVTISKIVSGNYGDKAKPFNFAVRFINKDNSAVYLDPSMEPSGIKRDSNTSYTFSLKHGDANSVTFTVPDGYTIEVYENNIYNLNEGYSKPTATINTEPVQVNQAQSTGTRAGWYDVVTKVDSDKKIVFTNNRDTTIPMGISNNNFNVYLLTSLIALGACILFILNCRKKRNL